MSFFFIRALGSIPGPILYGYLFDSLCLLKSGNCLYYDNESLAHHFVLWSVGIKVVGILITSSALYTAKYSKVPDEMDED